MGKIVSCLPGTGFGSAERSTDKKQMRDTFHTISDGGYANLLYKLFGKERVEKELEEFLEFDFFPRSGGGIGVTRIMQACLLYTSPSPRD